MLNVQREAACRASVNDDVVRTGGEVERNLRLVVAKARACAESVVIADVSRRGIGNEAAGRVANAERCVEARSERVEVHDLAAGRDSERVPDAVEVVAKAR